MFFRRSRSVRIVSDAVAESGLLGDDRPSLFLAGNISGREGLPGIPLGRIDEVGFSRNWSDPLLQRPPRNTGYTRNFFTDRTFAMQAGDCGSNLALVDIKEQLVYDGVMHAEIDYTGFAVIITFHPEAFGVLTDLLEISEQREVGDFSTFLIRMPAAAFSFPAQRGGPDPMSPGGTHIKKLHLIKRLEIQDMVVARATRRNGQLPDDASFLKRYEILRASKLTLEQK
jgi:hypothetical protein